MNRVWMVYDDSNLPGQEIGAIVGNRRFGKILIGKQPVEERMRSLFSAALPEAVLFHLESADAIEALYERITAQQTRETGRTRVLHFFSDYLDLQREVAIPLIQSASYAERTYAARQNGRSVFYAFPSVEEYCNFLCRAMEAGGTHLPELSENAGDIQLCGGEFLWIGAQEGLVLSLTSKYDARYFNHLISETDIVTKSSTNIEKLRAEYQFWHLLPDEMKIWFVMPFDFREDGKYASYRMERLYLPNLAVKYVHGAMDDEEFEAFLQRYFRFLHVRTRRPVSQTAYLARAEKLYLQKTRMRLDALKENPQFAPVAELIRCSSKYRDIDEAYERFQAVYQEIESTCKLEYYEVIGHGDACLSNILFDRASKTLKLIDPKGALTEDELWTDPYYDLCKLSHSIIGRYDFFNSGSYELTLDEAMQLHLELPFDHSRYTEALRKHLKLNGWDERMMRIGEAALFLSMLPLHMDNPRKVLGFFLNAMGIIDDLDRKTTGDA